MGSCLGNLRATAAENNNVDEDSSSTATTPTTICFWRRATDGQDVELISNASSKFAKRRSFIYRILKYKRKPKKHSQFLDKFWENSTSPNYDELTPQNGHDSFSDIQLRNLDVHNLINSATYAKESTMNFASGLAVGSSRTSSSLDLEWEHEYGNMRHGFQQQSAAAEIRNHPPSSQQQRQVTSDNYKALNEKDSWQYVSRGDGNYSEASESNTQSMQQLNTSLGANFGMARNEKRHMKSSNRGGGSITRNSSHNNSWSHISTPESLEWDIDEDQQQQMHVEDDNLDHETLQLLHQIEQLKNRVLHETGDGLYNEVNMNEISGGGIEFKVKYPSS